MAAAAAVDQKQPSTNRQAVPGSEKFLKKDQVAAMLGGSSGHGSGWRVLRDGEDPDLPSARDDKNPAVNGLDPIELRESGSSAGQGAGDEGDGVVTGDGGDAVMYKVYRRRWFGLVQLVLLNIIVSIDWLTFAPVSSSAAIYFNTSETTVNWLATLFLFSFVIATPAVIYVLHLGPRPSIIASASLVLAGNWIRYAGSYSSSSGRFGVVAFGQILAGLAQPFVLSAPARYSDLWFSPKGRVTATAVVSLANPFGAAIGQLIVPEWVSSPEDISSMVLYVSIIATVCSIPAFFIPARPPTPAAPSGSTPKLSLKESIHVLTSHLEFWLILIPFAVYVGFFNSVSSLLNQIMEPYDFSETDAGIAGALLIVVGLVAAAITSPIIDRTKAFITVTKSLVPVIALSYLAFVWMPETRNVAGPYVVLAVLGAASFSLIPVVIELLVELTHPISPEVTSTLAWSGGQLLGGVFIVISDALKAGEDGDVDGTGPPGNMKRALVFTAVVAVAVMPLPLFLGCFGRRENVALKRVRSDAGSSMTSA